MTRARSTFSLVFLLAFAPGLEADPLPRERVPVPLQPWVDWVLQGHEEAGCPVLEGSSDATCLWPSRLEITIDEKGGTFRQQWVAYRDARVPLPGDEERWPLDVKVDDRPAATSLVDGSVPSVALTAGAHVVTGSFAWARIPEVLPIPPATALVALTLSGSPVAFPSRDTEGRLWVQRRAASDAGESQLDVVVSRRVTDEVPLLLTTRVVLQVSGEGREVMLARALPDGFAPMSLSAPLPARLEPDGRLRVQVRPGTWQIELVARHDGPVSTITLVESEGPWAEDEAWVFEARNDLRLVSIEGVAAIDPAQTSLPEEWKGLPAYGIHAGETMKLVEALRGDALPAPDKLTLRRTYWLDFDGGGYTVNDQLTGLLERSWRLEMSPPGLLGRVAIDDHDQLITSRPDARDTRGIEIRQGRVAVDADSRIEGGAGSPPAVGWKHDVQQLTGSLNLPPGWSLLHASGVDEAQTTWVARFTLLDFFLILVVSMAFAKLWGFAWGALSMAGVVLMYHQPGAPRWIWLSLLVGEALVRVLPAGGFRMAARIYQLGVVIVLVLLAVPFCVLEVRKGMYPVLEYPHQPLVGGGYDQGRGFDIQNMNVYPEAAPPPPPAPSGGAVYEQEEAKSAEDVIQKAESSVMRKARKKQMVETKTPVTTGPGLPSWSWNRVELIWRGPVESDQMLSLWLLSPRTNLVLALLRVALLVVLFLRVLPRTAGDPRPGAPAAGAAMPLAAAATLFLVLTAPAAAQEIPTPEMLEELRTRLLAPSDCRPSCATAGRLAVEVAGGKLVARLELSADAPTAAPLPGDAASWLPSAVLLDEKPAPLSLTSDGRLWIALAPGAHQVLMEGPLPDRDTVVLPLPLQPHRVEARAEGYRVEGIHEDGTAETTLSFVRERRAEAAAGLAAGEMPPFLRIDRTLELGVTWQVYASVTRLTPPDAPIVVEVPLLPGESVTTEGLRVVDGKVLVSLPPQVMEAEWTSTLAEAEKLELVASTSTPWTEVWHLDASPLWHVEVGGIPVIHQQADVAERTREWRPWPGESVSLAISRPEGVAGQTLTIDRSLQSVAPGIRATDVTLTLGMRASRGGQQVVALPDGAELLSVSIDGATQPIRLEKGLVTLPVIPGAHEAQIAWRQHEGMGLRFVTPPANAGIGSVNARIEVAMPQGRWVLFAGGPDAGPAILFWSYLVVLLLVAIGLGRLRLAPLSVVSWFLLGLGMSQVEVVVGAIVAGWLLVIGWRRRKGPTMGPVPYNLLQLVIVGWTLVAMLCLFYAIEEGLLGAPEMQVRGNGSHPALLAWYQDRTGAFLPQAWVVSVPMMVYRLSMLSWALWLALALIGWLRWGWDAFRDGGFYKPLPRAKAPPAPKPPQVPKGGPAPGTPPAEPPPPPAASQPPTSA